MVHSGHIVGLYVYPVKGLSGQRLDHVTLTQQAGFPGDRDYALARPDGDYRPGTDKAFPKTQFFMLARNERLAGLTTHLAAATQRFTVAVGGHVVHESCWSEEEGRHTSAEFFARVLDLPPGQVPLVAQQQGRRFTDVSVVSDTMMHAVSFINLASVRALEERVGRSLDPLRFRANVYIDGWPAFAERGLLGDSPSDGKEIRLGNVRFRAVFHTRRCAATEVDPRTARRDIAVPRMIFEHYGHSEMGFYGETLQDGELRVGDPAELPDL